MMAATQPFLSGAISKTVNLPHDCSLDDIAEAYLESWRLGLKAVAIYRDGSKGAQPLNVSDGAKAKDIKGTSAELTTTADRILTAMASGHKPAEADLKALEAKVAEKVEIASKSILGASTAFTAALATPAHADPVPDLDHQQGPPRAIRHRLPDERASLTHKFAIAGHEGYITVGLYPNGQPGEIFIRMAKEGSTVSGLMDSFATAASLALQHGVPLKRPVREVRALPLRALRLDRQRAHRLRQVDHGLHLPLAPAPLPLRPAAHALRRHDALATRPQFAGK